MLICTFAFKNHLYFAQKVSCSQEQFYGRSIAAFVKDCDEHKKRLQFSKKLKQPVTSNSAMHFYCFAYFQKRKRFLSNSPPDKPPA